MGRLASRNSDIVKDVKQSYNGGQTKTKFKVDSYKYLEQEKILKQEGGEVCYATTMEACTSFLNN